MAKPVELIPTDTTWPVEKVRIHVEGEARLVPASITILDALTLSGHRYLRGCGCRAGDCGECAVLVRSPFLRHAVTELACEAPVRPEIGISRIPFQWNRAFRNRRQADR